MPRKIYARIWDKQNKNWLSQKVDIFSEEMRLCLNKIDNFSNFEISQDTGWKDTEGREIWEGDYLKIEYTYGPSLCVIDVLHSKFSAESVSSNVMDAYDLVDVLRSKVENYVVGNKYEDELPNIVKKIYHTPTDDSKLKEVANDQTKTADLFESSPIVSQPKRETACELCRCQAFDEAHMSDPMCVCGHNMSYHGMN